uniref:Protein LURP-one-related 15 n=1 Tax=Aegilops tauschii TaxID=37682 RepID=M8B5R1_AEGTA
MSSPSGKVKEAIVGEQFLATLATHPTKLTVTKLYTPNGPRFTFKNSAGGEAMLEVESRMGFMSLRSHQFLDATSAQPVIHLQETGLEERKWEAYRGNSTRESDKIFDAVNKSWYFFLMGTKIEVFLRKSSDEPKPAGVLVDGNSSGGMQKPADFVVLGNYYRGGLTINRVSRLFKCSEMGGEHTYDVSVKPGEDQAFVLALTVILDQMYNDDRVISSIKMIKARKCLPFGDITML